MARTKYLFDRERNAKRDRDEEEEPPREPEISLPAETIRMFGCVACKAMCRMYSILCDDCHTATYCTCGLCGKKAPQGPGERGRWKEMGPFERVDFLGRHYTIFQKCCVECYRDSVLPFARLREEIQGRARVVSAQLDRELKMRIDLHAGEDTLSDSDSEVDCG